MGPSAFGQFEGADFESRCYTGEGGISLYPESCHDLLDVIFLGERSLTLGDM